MGDAQIGESILAGQNKKINIPDQDRGHLLLELDNIGEILQAVESGDDNYAYADTSDSMDALDSIMGENPLYQETLLARREASRKIMKGNEAEKKEGFRQISSWVKQIKGML